MSVPFCWFLNHKKTICLHDGQRKEVTGIVVNEKISVPAYYKKKIRQEFYYLNKYGLESHTAKVANDENIEKYISGLLGFLFALFSFLHFFTEKDCIRFSHQFEESFYGKKDLDP